MILFEERLQAGNAHRAVNLLIIRTGAMRACDSRAGRLPRRNFGNTRLLHYHLTGFLSLAVFTNALSGTFTVAAIATPCLIVFNSF
jgi:hypothetical protein